LAGAICIAIIAILAALTFQRNAQYQSAESLWRDTLAKRPTSGRAHYNLAFALSEEAHEFPEGSPQFVALSQQASDEYEMSLKDTPSFAAEFRIAAALADAGDLAGAENAYDHLIEAYPNSPGGWNLLRGQIRARRQEWPGARDDFEKAVADRPDDPESHYLLGVVLQQLNNPRAASEFQRTLELSPGYKDAELRLMKVK
jgi:tetratricopeptide (TPR) repeat protein